ncbi:ABC transporter substrate-binding protein [Streptomyces flavochromogenes]|uniref:ABC transporter substrate-binding protein n=1 Tax=Streptomyces flavochromogenes TaxID=68199 RepID=UPI0004C1E765|nr:ABC transporter substrate-binding protein [Streptomyces flavochromogenes]
MSGTQAWGFTDDRGAELGAARVPRRVIAYVRAGAALCDLGVTPVAVYGSGHDGDVLDPAKDGGLTAAAVTYLGPGRVLDEGLLRELRPDVIVDVTYDGKSPYALDEAVAERLGVPLVALSVGNELTLPAILDRFGALAVSLGAAPDDGTTAEDSPGDLGAAEDELREVAARTRLAVLALSGAGPDQVHLARPSAWPELARLAELGVRLVDPGPGPGANWLTGDWGRASELRPGLVLFDSRAHATAPDAALSGVRFSPWNPETPPSPAAYARFFRALAGALAG